MQIEIIHTDSRYEALIPDELRGKEGKCLWCWYRIERRRDEQAKRKARDGNLQRGL